MSLRNRMERVGDSGSAPRSGVSVNGVGVKGGAPSDCYRT